MATEAFVQYRPGKGVIPATAADAEAMDALSPGKDYRAVFTRAQARSQRQHNLLFALIEIARDNSPFEISKDGVLDVLKLRTGHVRVTQLHSGEMILAPASINFASMDADAFKAWFPRAVDVICRDFVPGLEHELAIAEAENRVAHRVLA